jgi:hypothetical protein
MVERLVSASSTRCSTISSRLRADVFSLDHVEDSPSQRPAILHLRFVDLFFAVSVSPATSLRIHHHYACAGDILPTQASTRSGTAGQFPSE